MAVLMEKPVFELSDKNKDVGSGTSSCWVACFTLANLEVETGVIVHTLLRSLGKFLFLAVSAMRKAN
jgi:hypothetical protein